MYTRPTSGYNRACFREGGPPCPESKPREGVPIQKSGTLSRSRQGEMTGSLRFILLFGRINLLPATTHTSRSIGSCGVFVEQKSADVLSHPGWLPDICADTMIWSHRLAGRFFFFLPLSVEQAHACSTRPRNAANLPVNGVHWYSLCQSKSLVV